MEQLIVKSLEVSDSEKNVYVEGYASAAVKDLDGEIITEEALHQAAKELTQEPYNKVFLNHNTKDIPIGKIVEAEVRSGKLWVKLKLNKAHPEFETVYKSLKDGFLDAFSIGFKAIERKGSKITRLKILEISLVGVPANPEAVIEEVYEKMKKGKISDEEMLEEDKLEDEIEEKCKAGSRHHRAINRVAARLARMGKLGLKRKCIACDDEEVDFKDYENKAESDCKPPEESGGEMVGETCSGWVDPRTGKELTWAEFKRRLATALGIKPTQYIRNIFYAAWKRGLISTEEMRQLGYNVREEDREKSEEAVALKSPIFKEESMSEEVEKKMEKLTAEIERLKAENEELRKKLEAYEEKEKAAIIEKIKKVAAITKAEVDEEKLKKANVAELRITLGELAEKIIDQKTAEKVKTPVEDSADYIETKWGRADARKVAELRKMLGLEEVK